MTQISLDTDEEDEIKFNKRMFMLKRIVVVKAYDYFALIIVSFVKNILFLETL